MVELGLLRLVGLQIGGFARALRLALVFLRKANVLKRQQLQAPY